MASEVAPRRLAAPIDAPSGAENGEGAPRWGSDVAAAMLRRLGVEYVALNPGSSFRGLHDSLVNYLGNRSPSMILVNHEMISVAMARGYARVTGRPMAAILHDHVGLLNAGMAIYDAWVDRVPVLVLGGTGPIDAASKRPWIDWIHSSNDEGAAVRDFTKWDDQPASVAAIPESLLRAWRIAQTEPGGPVYVCLDATLQELPVEDGFPFPDVARFGPAAATMPDPEALRTLARWLVDAELPLILEDRVGRSEKAIERLVELAELLAIPVIDGGLHGAFPTPHPMDFSGAEKQLLVEADVVLGLDLVDLAGTLLEARVGPAGGPRIATITMDDYAHRGASTDYQGLPPVDLPMLGDTRLALPELLEQCRALIDGTARSRIERRRAALATRQGALHRAQEAALADQWDHPEVTEPRLAAEITRAVEGEPFTFVYGKFRGLAPSAMRLSGPRESIGWGVAGGAIGMAPGVAVGAALALKDSGRLPVAMLGDGEMLGSIQVLWTAAHYRIPSLLVLNNNRSYFNDEAHQDRIARIRGRPPENRWIGQRLEDPELDFAAMARNFGVHGEGPVSDPADLPAALARGVVAAREGQTAVVDVRTERRPATSGRERPIA
jgi:thiamine pyrophosphate-dependent acetolactate synthase large subunit-like protein